MTLLPESPTAATPLLAVYHGSPGRLVFRWERNGEVVGGIAGDRLPVGHFRKGDTVEVIAKGNEGELRATALIGNLPPTIRQVVLVNPKLHRGVGIELQPVGEDPDGDETTFTYSWLRNDEPVNFADGNRLTGDQFNRGDRIRFVVVPHDGTVAGEPYQSSDIVIPNAPPIFVTTPPPTFQADIYSYRVRAEDPDGDVLTYALATAPTGMKIDPKTGLIEWALAGVSAGEHQISIVADDSSGQQAYQDYTLTLTRP